MIIFRESIKRILKNKVKFSVLLLAPFIFIGMFAMMDAFYLSVGVVDKDNSLISKRLTENLDNAYKIVKLNEDQILDSTVSYNVSYTVIIEKGFGEKLIAGEKPKLKEFYMTENPKIHSARILINNFIDNIKMLAAGTDYNKEKFKEAFQNFSEGKLVTRIESKEESEYYKTGTALGFLIQFMLYMSIITAGLILEDRAKGIFYRTFYAPVSLKRYLLENMAAFIAVALIQVIVVFSVLKAGFGLNFSANFISMLLLFFVFAVCCVAFGLFIISLFKKPIQAYTSVALITTPLVMLGGCYWPREMMPDTMQKISAFVPTTWVMEGVNKLLSQGKNISAIATELGMLLLFTAIFLAAGLLKKVDVAK
ncbi:MAG: ABC transporter permease [Bacillota bacterium]